MIDYEQFLNELKALSEESFAQFQKRIIRDDKLEILGVRTPLMRKIAKKYCSDFESVMSFPDEYYEVVFVKLQIASTFDFARFTSICDECVILISDWALCDCFAPACIKRNKDNFVPYIEKYLSSDSEFVCRFALTTLLHFYVEEEYYDLIINCINKCGAEKYYVMMAAAWLLAELIIKDYAVGFKYLNSNMCDINIKNKAISKACDSYRLSEEQKIELKTLKNKNVRDIKNSLT